MHCASSLAKAQTILALTNIRGIGRRTAIDLWLTIIASQDELGDDPHEVFVAAASKVERVYGSETDLGVVWRTSEQQVAEAHEAGLRVLSYFDDDYPERLRGIPDPPAVLFIKGRVEALQGSATVAVVGTREPTPFGVRAAFRAGQRTAEAGVTVVSGLALGCDAQAHEGCVSRFGTGVAVLAHGLDRVYPAKNRELADLLLESGGCWVSEYPLGTRPARGTFVERDRIQSGLADGVLVIETDVQGGTMHTVRYSQQQHRRLACIDHPQKWWHHPKTRGNRKLIEEGAAEPIGDAAAMVRFLRDMSGYWTSSQESDRLDDEGTDQQLWWNEMESLLVPDDMGDSGAKLPLPEPEAPEVPTVKESHTYRPSEDAIIVKVVNGNPKRANSRARTRFDLYVSGMTVGQYLTAGGEKDDIYEDIAHAYIVVSDYPYAELARWV